MACLLLVLVAGWIGIRALLARSHLLAARAEVAQLRSQVSEGNLTGLAAGLAKVQRDAAAAHNLTSDPIWGAAASIPLLGRSLRTGEKLATAVNELARRALPPLISAASTLDPKAIRLPGGRIDLVKLSSTAPQLAEAETALRDTQRQLASLRSAGVIGAINKAGDQLRAQLSGLVGSVDSAARAARIGPAVLGEHGVRRYLVIFQNPAEARGTGGLAGSFAILKIDKGKVTRERTGSDNDLRDSPTPVINLGAEYNARYAGLGATEHWAYSNYSPHFPDAAQIWQQLWFRQTGERVDGVLAVDPVALGYFLQVTGPVTLSDGEVISAANVAHWTMVDAYARYANDNARRKQLTVELAKKALDRLSSGQGSSTALLKAMGRAAGERRLLAWFTRPQEEAAISGIPLAGELPSAPGPFAALVVWDFGGSKLDYYLRRTLDYRVMSCTPTRRLVRVTFTLDNAAPSGPLPAYVTTRVDGRKVPAGESRQIAYFFAADGAALTDWSVNGKKVPVGIGIERGHSVFQFDLELPIGKPQTVQMDISEPSSSRSLTVPIQPLAQPMQTTLSSGCP